MATFESVILASSILAQGATLESHLQNLGAGGPALTVNHLENFSVELDTSPIQVELNETSIAIELVEEPIAVELIDSTIDVEVSSNNTEVSI